MKNAEFLYVYTRILQIIYYVCFNISDINKVPYLYLKLSQGKQILHIHCISLAKL